MHAKTSTLALLLGAFAAALAILTSTDPGLGWDEPYYIDAGLSHLDFFINPSGGGESLAARIDHHWIANHQHPPLAKVGIGISMLAFGPWLPWLLAARLPAAVMFGLAVSCTFLIGDRLRDRPTGLAGAMALACIPRFFGHAHFAALDMPMVAIGLLTCYAFVRSIDDWRWSPAAGVLLGLAWATKVHGILLLPPLLVWGWFYSRRGILRTLPWLVLAPVTLFLCWPWLWNAPVHRLAEYLTTRTGRDAVPVLYFGRIFSDGPPWHYPLVMMLIAVPLAIVGLAAVQVIIAIRQKAPLDRLTCLALLCLAAVVLPSCLPGAPRYDGLRQILPAIPWVAVLAGGGAVTCYRYILARWSSQVAMRCLLALVTAAHVASIIRLHPYELSHYSLIVGGLKGANALGLEPTCWGDAVAGETIEWINNNCPPDGRVWIHPVGSQVVRLHQVLENFRPDIQLVTDPEDRPELVVLVNRRAFWHPRAAALFAAGEGGVYMVERQGVPLVLIYRIDRTQDGIHEDNR
jgi:4-amino-4-deoxy-L-arabinose transferase-like glycosyltransferase